MGAILDSLGLDYEVEKAFSWSENRYYDFYFKDINCIIEVHGFQHYEDKLKFEGCRSFKDEVANDLHKKELAINNGIDKYIIVDARQSELNWLRKSITNELGNLFDFSNIDWNVCFQKANRSRLIEACKLYSEGMSSNKIAELFKVNYCTVLHYLKRGTEIGLCDYVNDCKRPVICLDTQERFLCVADARRYSNGKHISECCKGTCGSSGRHPITGKALHWAYLKDFENQQSVNSDTSSI
jgi:hypothetical protein